MAADPRRAGSETLSDELWHRTKARVEDLCENFRRAGFAAQSAGGSMAEIYRLDAPESQQERREVEVDLRVWQAMRPEAVIEILM